uniref:IS66 family transposase zinc-finger binding domain-containing protein n=1 Tax=Burkholderia alba TaxID=2683677 RepID=UPI0038994436
MEIDPDRVCPTCGSAMRPLGEDLSEQLAHVSAAFKVNSRAVISTHWICSLN